MFQVQLTGSYLQYQGPYRVYEVTDNNVKIQPEIELDMYLPTEGFQM